MKKLSQYTDSAVGFLPRNMSRLATLIVMFLMVIITIDVITRNAFHTPIRGAHELIEFGMILIVFFGLAYAQYTKSHISVSLVVDRLPQKVQFVVGIIVSLLMIGIVSLVTWAAFVHFRYLLDAGRNTAVLKMPMAAFEIALFVGLVVLLIVLIAELVQSVYKAVKR